MVKQVIKKIISLILVSTMLIGNICTYVSANDFKLSIIYMLDAIEDMEYKEREDAYKKEHESFIAADENNENVETTNNIVTSDLLGASDSASENDFVGASDSVGASYASPNHNEEDTTTSEYETEPEEDETTENTNIVGATHCEPELKESVKSEEVTTTETSVNDININKLTGSDIVNEEGHVATSSDVEENDSNSNEEEKEDDTTTQSSDNTNVDIATKSEIEDGEKDESEEAVSTPSDVIYIENADVSTKSEIKKYAIELEHIATESEISIATKSEISDEVRMPEKYYSEYKTYEDKLVESGAVLTGYDKYGRTYLVEENVGTDEKGQTLNKFVKIIGSGKHYIDKDGKLKENNDILIKKEQEVKSPDFRLFGGLFGASDNEDDIVNDEIYTNAEGKSEIEVSSNGNNGYSIKNGEYEIKIVPVTGNYSKSKVLDNAIRYSNVFDNIDVQYTIIDGNVKEDIILLDKSEINLFSYKLEFNGLSANKEEDSIEISNADEKVVFNLTAPAIIDAEGKISDKIEIRYNEEENIVTYVADREFLEGATYPVRIDPIASTIEEDDGYAGMEMHSIQSNRSNRHYDNLEYKKFGNFEGSICRQMVWVDPEVFIGPGITNSLQVELALNTVGCFTNGEVGFKVGKVNENWDKDSITWNTKPNNISFINNVAYSTDIGEEMTFNITQFFREWITNPNPTPTVDEEGNTDYSYIRNQVKGLVLMLDNESLNNKYETFMTGNLSPRIQVTYNASSVNSDLFLMDIADSEFHIGAATKKTSTGGQTVEGVVIYGLTQSMNHGPVCEHDCESDNDSHIHHSPGNHKVTIQVKSENNNYILNEIINPEAAVVYPDYKLVNTSCTAVKTKDCNVQSSPIMLNCMQLNTIYKVKVIASGCREYEEWDEDVTPDDDDYTGPSIIKHHAKHRGGSKTKTFESDSDNENVYDIDFFLLYKVKMGDTLDRIAGHYGVSPTTIKNDNHFKELLGYENSILFIRNPIRLDELSTELSAAELQKIREQLILNGRSDLLCAYGLEPVNMSTGDFYLEHTDASVPELGNDEFKISRSYNSISRGIKSDFGYGFNSIINDRLMVSGDGTAMHFASDGGGDVYIKSSNGNYKGQKGDSVLIPIRSLDGTDVEDIEDEYDEDDEIGNVEETFDNFVSGSNYWQIKYKDGRIYTYNSGGAIKTIEDNRGLKYTYNYDSRYRPTSIVTPSGMIFSFTFNSNDLISKITLPDGTYISYEYDANKNLIKVTDAENRITSYEYDSDHKMTAWSDADGIRQVLNTYDSSGRVIKQVDANGNEATINYYSDRTVMVDNEGIEHIYLLDTKKRTKSQLFGSSVNYEKEFNNNGQIKSVVDENGVTANYTYNTNGNLIKEERTDGDFTISRSWIYDDNGNILSETDYNGNTTTYTYDARNNLTKITDPCGNTEEMTYDSLSRMTSKKDRNGNITHYTYSGNNPLPETTIDARGNVTRWTYDTMRRKTSETDAEGYTSSIQYDRTGRKLKETDKRGNETNYTYSSRGTVTKIKDRENNETTFTYDNVGNILTGTDNENNTLTYEYDRNYNKILEKNLPNEKKMLYNDKGQIIEEIDALNHSKRYTLDGVGNIIKEVDRNGNEINYRYNNVLNKIIEKIDGNGKTTRYNYDNNGNLLKEIKADNSEINYEYDALNQLTKITNEEGIDTNFTYDANGNITKKETDNRVIEYTYDEVNNLTEEKNPLGYTNKLEYDAIGNITKLTDENDYAIEYTYDANSNVTKIKDAENNEEEYTYDRENKKLTYKNKNGNITRFSYDRAGRVIKMINALNEKEQLEYDSNDNIIKNILFNADGSIFSETNRTYNALNKLVEEIDAENHTIAYTYDNNENITAITNKNGDIKTFTYDASNNVIESTDEMGLTTQYEYDDVYNIIRVNDNSNATLDSNGAIIGANICEPIETREYDRVGNLIKVVDALNRNTQYEYNSFGEQVKKIDKDGAITQYNYDNNGNLTKVIRPDNQELIYTYDKHNKLIKSKLNDVEYEYTYDKNYNIVEEKNPLGNVATFTYDNVGNTVEVKDEEDNTIAYTYDELNRVIKQTDSRNDDVNIKYDRNNNVVEIKTAENITNKFEYDKESRLTKEIDGENHFVSYEYDGIGNILKKTTESNEITTYTYDKHNVMTSMTDALNNTERYETNLNKQIVKKIQKDGTIYKYNYDRVKRLTSTIDPMNYRINLIYSLGDDILKTTDTLGRQVNYEYDILHNLTKKIDANGKDELYIYDNRGNVTKKIDRRETAQNFKYDLTDNLIEYTDANNNKTTYTYDKVGNIKELKQPNGGLIKYDYDANYNRIKVTNPRGKSTNYVFDRDNRLVSETDPNGNIKRYDYNRNNNLTKFTSALGNIHKFEYDTDNNLIKEIDPRNKVKQYTYDKLHRLTKTTSELNNTAIFTYDTVDNVVGIKDPKGTNTVFDYNDVGKVVQERSVDNTIRTYNYDRAGRLISKINKDQSKIAYDYDANDNLIKKYYLDLSNQQTDDSIIYSYNAENNRLGMNDKSGLSRTLYDNNGNLIVSTSNNDRDIIRYEYDSNDRLIKIVYPTNATVTYTYDANGNIKTVTDKDGLKTTYTYDDNDNEVIRTTGLIETNKRYDADNRLIRIKNEHRLTGELIDEYSYRYDNNSNIIEEIKREPYRKKVSLLDIDVVPETNNNIRVTKQNFTYDDENKLTDARVERLGMKDLSEANVTTYHYEYDPNGNRTQVEIKDDGLTLESTVYTYDRLNKLVSSREVTASGLYLYEYTYDDNGSLIKEDRHRAYELNTNQWTNIRRYEYTKDNKLESVYSGNTLLVSYTYDGDGTITSSFERDLDLNQNLNIHDTNYINSLTTNQRQLINKVSSNDSFLYELTEYITDKNRSYSEALMERDGTGHLSTIYTYGNQRISTESYNNLSGLYTYDGRGSVSAVIGSYGDFRASYWYDGLGNVKSQIHGYGAFGSGKKYYGYNGEQYNPVTGNQNLRNRQVNIRRQRFLTEDTFLGTKDNTLTLNRYIYGNGNPLKYKDPSGNIPWLAIVGIASVVSGVAVGIYEGVRTGDWKKGVKAGVSTTLTVGVIGLTFGVASTGVLAPTAANVASGLLTSTQIVTAGGSGTGAILSTTALAGTTTKVATEKFIEGKNISGTDALNRISNNTIKAKFAGDIFSVGAIGYNQHTGNIDRWINNFNSNSNNTNYQYGDIIKNAGYVNSYGTGASDVRDVSDDIADYLGSISNIDSSRLGSEIGNAISNATSQSCHNVLNRPDYYVKPNGEVIPATGYRYMNSNDPFTNEVIKNMSIPAQTDPEKWTYISFDKYDVAAKDWLQTPHPADVRASFDTLQTLDDLQIPKGQWNTADYYEPITKDYIDYGRGGATQAITQKEIKIDEIVQLPKTK